MFNIHLDPFDNESVYVRSITCVHLTFRQLDHLDGFPCCYYVHCMFVFHIANHCNFYAPCGSLIGQ